MKRLGWLYWVGVVFLVLNGYFALMGHVGNAFVAGLMLPPIVKDFIEHWAEAR